METQKTVNLLNDSDNENSKFSTKKLYVIDIESKGVYSHEDEINFQQVHQNQVFVIVLMHIS